MNFNVPSSIIGVSPFEVPLHVLHIWSNQTSTLMRTLAAEMSWIQAARGWRIDVASPSGNGPHEISHHRWRQPEELTAIVDGVKPDAIVCHGAQTSLDVRRQVAGETITICISPPRPGPGGTNLWREHRVAADTNAMIIPDAATSRWFRNRGIRVPLFLVDNRNPAAHELWAAVIARAYAFGGMR